MDGIDVKMYMKTRPLKIVSRFLFGMLLMISAGSVTGSAQGNETLAPPNAEEFSHLSGNFAVDGSSTVYLVTAAAAEEFLTFAPDVHINVRFSGTSGGFDRFCAGETEMQDASRPIKPEEVATCAENGIEYIELPVAIDGLTVVVNSENDWVDCLTVEELRTMWQPESEGMITNWSQVRPGFPNAPLHLYGAGGRSGTFDYFTEAINGTTGASRLDYVSSEDDTELVAGVSNDKNALGYFGYAYYVENREHLKAVPIRNPQTGTCTAPSEESVIAGSYQPLSRPLFIYVRADQAKQPEINAFVNFYLSPAFTPLIDSPEIGYVPLQDDIYLAVAARFNAGTTGTLFPDGLEIGATLDRYLDEDGGHAGTPAATPVP